MKRKRKLVLHWSTASGPSKVPFAASIVPAGYSSKRFVEKPKFSALYVIGGKAAANMEKLEEAGFLDAVKQKGFRKNSAPSLSK